MRKIALMMFLLMGTFTFCLAQQIQEVVYLKNGSVIRGTIIEQIPNSSLKIQTNDGSIFAYEMNEVEKITKESSPKGTTYTYNGSSRLDGNGAKRGYRGFMDLGYTIGTGGWVDTNRLEFATSHGYQFNPYFYLGAGAGVHYYHQADLVEIPIFADFRVDILNHRITPYIDFRIGYTVYEEAGFYAAPTGGCRINMAGIALNIGIGYTIQKFGHYWGVKAGGCIFKLGMDF